MNKLVGHTGQTRRIVSSILLGSSIVAALIYFLIIMPLPFFIYKPGSAESIHPMVQVQQGSIPEAGTFMLTTVRAANANITGYLYASINPYHQLVLKKEVFREGETANEYSQRQSYVMLDSQSNAIQAAYNKAGIPYYMNVEAVIILQVKKNMPAADALLAGDHILQLDDMPIAAMEDVIHYISDKKVGDEITVTVKRKNQLKTETLALGRIEADADSNEREGIEEEGRPGLGVILGELHVVQAEQPERQVSIKAGEIGGPSAGLMFALEIYSQITQQDMTKGYRIAGTGTIDPHGNVGQIGGIQHKIVAADREKADIFFAPNDRIPGPGESFQPVKNTSDAIERAKKIGTKMEVVSVGTLDEALHYLQSLPPKNATSNGEHSFGQRLAEAS